MMKKLLTITFLTILNFSIAQTLDSIDMNGGYAMDVFYSLENGSVQTVANAEWTVAFSSGAQTASIYINDGNGVELYETTEAIADFATVDTAGISTWPKSYNQYTDWDHSAFENSATGHPDYGWGTYNSTSHIVTGDKVFVLKTLAEEYYKVIVEDRDAGEWHFRYASLDNSFDTTIAYNATDLQDKNFGYLNMDNHLLADREASNEDWDMLFTKYFDTDINYPVTGVLVNKGVEIVEIDDASHADASYIGETFSDVTKTIGSDWKTFDMTSFTYVLDDMKTYFVKRLNGDIYKLHFTRFDGSSTGKTVFSKEKLVASPITNIENINTLSVYPNPAKNSAQLVLDLNSNTELKYSIYNMIGNQLENKTVNLNSGMNVVNLDLSNFTSGIYLVQIQNGNQVETIKLNVTK